MGCEGSGGGAGILCCVQEVRAKLSRGPAGHSEAISERESLFLVPLSLPGAVLQLATRLPYSLSLRLTHMRCHAVL